MYVERCCTCSTSSDYSVLPLLNKKNLRPEIPHLKLKDSGQCLKESYILHRVEEMTAKSQSTVFLFRMEASEKHLNSFLHAPAKRSAHLTVTIDCFHVSYNCLLRLDFRQ